MVAANSHESPPNSGAFTACIVAPPRGQVVVVTVTQANLEKRVTEFDLVIGKVRKAFI